jgi:murein DD-endopeptidase MepM/ murein hydrolase activator NlpD
MRPWRAVAVAFAGLAAVATAGWFMVQELRAPSPASDVPQPPARQISAQDAYPESGTPMPAAPAVIEPDQPIGDASGSVVVDEAPRVYEMSVRLEKGDTVAGVLRELDLAAGDVAQVIEALTGHVNLRRLPVGQSIDMKLRAAAEGQTSPILLALAVRPEARREVTIERDAEGEFDATVKDFAIVSKLQRAAGAVNGSVIESVEASGVPHAALAEMLRAYSWDVNFQHDIKAGDRFALLVERAWTEDGRAVDGGRILWAEITTGGGKKTFAIYRFQPKGGADFFYSRDGESVVKALLRTPLNLSRVSSRFGMRRHPVLGFTRLHAGVDFAAPTGTPVLAAGDGRVVEAGTNGGYGRWVKIRHDNGLATGYAHLSRIAPGVRRSARIRQGQVIGFVGSTGLSTGPHLHFELHRAGRPVNPLDVAQTSLRRRLGGTELARFKARVQEIDRARDSAPALE